MSRNADRVLEAVHSLDHPTADEVWDHMGRAPDAPSRATVYRALAYLVDAGRLRLREIGRQNRYDPLAEAHIHLHDTTTGRLIDAPVTDRLRGALEEVAADHMQELDDWVIEIRGRIKET